MNTNIAPLPEGMTSSQPIIPKSPQVEPKRHPLTEGRHTALSFPIMMAQKKTKSTTTNVMNQSTIYKRHAARVLKTQAKADDPRPKVVRVLAGLPGFRVLMDEYQAPAHNRSIVASPATAAEHTGMTLSSNTADAFNDETVVDWQLTPVSQKMSATMDTSSSSSHTTTLGQPLHVVLAAAGALGAIAELCYGSSSSATSYSRTTSTTFPKSLSPFSQAEAAASSRLAAASSAAKVVAQENGFFRVAAASSHQSRSASWISLLLSSPPKTISTTSPFLLAGGSTASVLFGTKALIDGQQNSNSPTAVLSSALAGAMVAATTFLSQHPSSRFLATTGTTATPLVARHAAGATLYFSSYDAMKSWFVAVPNNNNNNNILATAVAGATAGALYQGTLLVGAAPTAGMTRPLLLGNPAASRSLGSAMIRAAPAHALLFLGYEWVQQSRPS